MTLIDNYKQSAYNDIEKAKQGIVARVDKRKSLQYHLTHLNIERSYLPNLTLKVQNILQHHMYQHKLAVAMKE